MSSAVILRAAGDDNFPADYNPDNAGSAHVRDAYVHMLAKKGGMDLDVRNAEKVIVYLNGQYWGVYDIRKIPMSTTYGVLLRSGQSTISSTS